MPNATLIHIRTADEAKAIPIPDEARALPFTIIRAGQGGTTLSHDQVMEQLPRWVDKYNVGILLDTRKVYLGPRDFEFNRGQHTSLIQSETRRLTSTRLMIRKYQEDEANVQRELNRLKEASRYGSRGKPLDELRQELLSWPSIIDVQFGPYYDDLSNKFVNVGELVVTFLPVAYTATDMGFGRGKYAVTNPVRFVVKENGALSGIGVGDSTTYHPHISQNNVCGGNMSGVFAVMAQSNDFLGAMSVLEEYSLSHKTNDYYNRTWHHQAWAWWQDFQRGNKRELWLFEGRWDGASFRIARPGGPITTFKDFFGGSVDDVAHVGSGLSFISKTDVSTYRRGPGVQERPCYSCRQIIGGCSCHGAICVPCGQVETSCGCPVVEGERAGVRQVRITGGTWTYLTSTQALEGLVCESESRGCWCGRSARIQGPRGYFCEQHIPATVRARFTQVNDAPTVTPEAIEQRRMVRFERDERWLCEYGQTAQGATGRLCRNDAAEGYEDVHDWLLQHPNDLTPQYWCDDHRPVMVRHIHEHSHAGAMIRRSHSHNHEHLEDHDSRPDYVPDHDGEHIAFRYQTGIRRMNHERIT